MFKIIQNDSRRMIEKKESNPSRQWHRSKWIPSPTWVNKKSFMYILYKKKIPACNGRIFSSSRYTCEVCNSSNVFRSQRLELHHLQTLKDTKGSLVCMLQTVLFSQFAHYIYFYTIVFTDCTKSSNCIKDKRREKKCV